MQQWGLGYGLLSQNNSKFKVNKGHNWKSTFVKSMQSLKNLERNEKINYVEWNVELVCISNGGMHFGHSHFLEKLWKLSYLKRF